MFELSERSLGKLEGVNNNLVLVVKEAIIDQGRLQGSSAE